MMAISAQAAAITCHTDRPARARRRAMTLSVMVAAGEPGLMAAEHVGPQCGGGATVLDVAQFCGGVLHAAHFQSVHSLQSARWSSNAARSSVVEGVEGVGARQCVRAPGSWRHPQCVSQPDETVRIRVFTVPSGMCSSSATSLWV